MKIILILILGFILLLIDIAIIIDYLNRWKKKMKKSSKLPKECTKCGFLNEYGYCYCNSYDKWYACPIENKKPENVKALIEYGKEINKWVVFIIIFGA